MPFGPAVHSAASSRRSTVISSEKAYPVFSSAVARTPTPWVMLRVALLTRLSSSENPSLTRYSK